MSGVVVTISSRVEPHDLERQARARVERDGVAVVAAATSNRRQVRQLRRLAGRLEVDAGLECRVDAVHTGTTYLIVRALGSDRPVNWRGDAKTG
jgi:hypothetical protein